MLKIEGLQLSFGQQSVLRDFGLTLASGTLGVLVGPNGSGKSSVLNAITGVIPEYIKAELSGTILLDNIRLQDIPLKEKFHYLWYSPAELSFFFPSCETELAFALQNLGIKPSEIRQRIADAALRFGLQEEMQHAPHTLSAGQQKLLHFAMAEALDAPLVLLDEPSQALSAASLELLITWLQELKERNRLILIAEHHPRLIAMAEEIFELTL